MLVTANVLQPLIDVFESVLKFFHTSGGISWGWSIVLLTIAVRALLVPLTLRQIKGMVKMQTFAPQMKEIQKKYKDDKQRQQQEMMKFYRENNINPLASCLPLVLQLPVFVSLYFMLRESLRSDICPQVQLHYQQMYAAKHGISLAAAHGQTTACGANAGAHFLFISDLTAKATGVTLGILIVLYVGSQIGSTLVMSTANVDPNQRRIMMALPLIFVLFVIRFPAGLLVYWITTNLWTVAQQYVVKRRVGPAQAAAAAAAAAAEGGGSSGGSGGSGGSGSGGSGGDSGGRGSSGGGLAARLRERLAEQSSAGQSARGDRSGNGNGGSSTTKPPPKPAKASGSSGRGSSGRGSSGRGSGGNGSGSDSGGSGENGASSRSAPPPRSPRKKKKRSGRRR